MTLREDMLADLATFVSPDEFGTAAVIGTATVHGLFDRRYVESNDTAGYKPVFMCAESDVSDIEQGDAVTIASVGYTVASVEPDGTGMVRLVLMET